MAAKRTGLNVNSFLLVLLLQSPAEVIHICFASRVNRQQSHRNRSSTGGNVDNRAFLPLDHLRKDDVGHNRDRIDVEAVQVPDGGLGDLGKVFGVVVGDTDVVDYKTSESER